jgi:hypothetical protein
VVERFRFLRFFELLILVALIAAIYAPPIQLALENRISASGSASPTNTGWSGISKFTDIVRSKGYPILISNSTSEDLNNINGTFLYILIGPDKALDNNEESIISSMMKNGNMTLLIAQGNSSNNDFLNRNFGLIITGNPIIDPNSQFDDNRVSVAKIHVNTSHKVLINVASPIIKKESDNLFSAKPIGFTENQTYDLGNETRGGRVIAVELTSTNKTKGIIFSDSGIFINSNFNSSATYNLSRLADESINYLTDGNINTTIIIDNNHYEEISVSREIPFTLPPLGMILATYMISFLKTFNESYDNYLMTTPFIILLGISILSLIGTYFSLRRWMGKMESGIDTMDMPKIESSRLVESTSSIEIANLKKSGNFYQTTLTQLYYVIDELFKREYGFSIKSMDGRTERLLIEKVGQKNSEKLAAILKELTIIREKTEGERRFIFPPIFSWKRKFNIIIDETNQVLKSLGTHLMDREDREKGIEYKLRKR